MERRMLSVLAVVLCGLWLPALAGDGYVGASYMNSEFEFVQGSDASSSGWKIFGGYNFIKYFGVELTYYDLGSFDEGLFEADVKVFDLAPRGILPLGERFELFAKLGYSNVDVEGIADWELMYGAGAGLKLGKKFGIRIEYEAWDVETSLSAWSIGGYFRFGGN